MITRLGAMTLLLALTGACGEESGAGSPERADQPSAASPSDSPTAQPSDSESPPAEDHGTKIVVAPSDYGPMLFDDTGQAIYLFDVETSAEPACYGACAKAWPPVLTKGSPVVGSGVKKSLLGTTERNDGTTQVTYNGHPLYFYAHEGKREVLCHNIEGFGGLWLVVQPDGRPGPT
jgi:predicted lipoprotein with Yx(FWY)xxD motif